jgi:hypothetical protein
MLDDLSRRLAPGSAHFPHTLDPLRDRLLLVQLSDEELAKASFLDQRILTPATKGDWVSFADVAARLDPSARDDAHYIFHIGHVGSTLLSRLLGGSPGVLALREPLLLRSIAELTAGKDAVDAPWNPAELPGRIALMRRILARTFRPDQRAVIKATSFTSEIAPQMIAPGARCVLLCVSLQSYMRTILAGDASRQELVVLSGPRLKRLAHRLDPMPFRLWALSEGERVALAWVTEMLSLSAATQALPAEACLWLDFDGFLADPVPSLLRVAGHFGIDLDDDLARRLVDGPIMHSYSKAPEHHYDTALRQALQAQAASEHAEALAEGERWVERLASIHPAVAALRGLTA